MTRNDTQLDTRSKFERYLENAFGCDIRSLALFRVVMGIILLVDLATRFPYIHAFYTDDGFFTRNLCRTFFSEGYWSFHLLSGSEEFQVALFFIAAVFAVALTFGFQTRIALIASWLLLISLHVRNPLLLNSGDTLLRAMMFWSIFLPLGRYCSIDAWLQKRKGKEASTENRKVVLSGASFAIIIQLCFMYWFTGIAKYNDAWLNGQALEYVLRMDLFIKPMGKQLLEFPQLLKVLSIGTVWIEIIGPFLLFLPKITRQMRILMILAFFSLHLGILITISVGLFSAISMMGWLPLIPSVVWDKLGRLTGLFKLPDMTPLRSSNSVRGWRLASSALAIALVLYLLVWNVRNIETLEDSESEFVRNAYTAMDTALVEPWLGRDSNSDLCTEYMGRVTMLAQEFEMFGPVPETNQWFVYRAKLENGKTVDLLHGGPASDERPDPVMEILPNHRWRKLHRNLMRYSHARYREPLAQYACKMWNREHGEDEQIVKMDMVSFVEPIRPGQTPGNFVEVKMASVKFREDAELGAFNDLLNAIEGGGSIFP